MDPVFVIGAPRSGTTALAQALGRHSHFYAGDETLFLLDLFGGGRAERIHEHWSSRPSSSWLRRERVSRTQFLAALGEGIDGLLASAAPGRRWVDHVPVHAQMAETLAGVFPRARFLHVVRDGREVVQSMLSVPKTLTGDEAERMRQANFLPPWTRDFLKACECWQANVRAAAEFERRHPDRCVTVRHRQLETDPVAAMAEVLRFLDAPEEKEPAEFLQHGHRHNSSFAPPGGCAAAEYRRPDPRTTWSGAQEATFADVCAADMEALGLA